jgi:(2R)-ethylmalonyl-CoA mutase
VPRARRRRPGGRRGIIPEEDRARLLAADVAAVYTPKDFELTKIMGDIVDLAIQRRG